MAYEPQAGDEVSVAVGSRVFRGTVHEKLDVRPAIYEVRVPAHGSVFVRRSQIARVPILTAKTADGTTVRLRVR